MGSFETSLSCCNITIENLRSSDSFCMALLNWVGAYDSSGL